MARRSENLLEASVRLSSPRSGDFPDPKKYYRYAKAAIIPDMRVKNSLSTVDAAVDRLSTQTVFPVIPWLYVQLDAIRKWEIASIYIAGTLSVNRASWGRWEWAKDEFGLRKLWTLAGEMLPWVKEAHKVVDRLSEMEGRLKVPEPDDDWPLRCRTWFTRSVNARAAAHLASLAGLRATDFGSDTSIRDIRRKLEKRTKSRSSGKTERKLGFMGTVYRAG